jgi:hypothetical protein
MSSHSRKDQTRSLFPPLSPVQLYLTLPWIAALVVFADEYLTGEKGGNGEEADLKRKLEMCAWEYLGGV